MPCCSLSGYAVPPVSGRWTARAFPKTVRIGTVWFERSAGLSRPGVVAHYREMRGTDSLHLYVMRNGTWRVDHVDAVNPNWGPASMLRHLLVDLGDV